MHTPQDAPREVEEEQISAISWYKPGSHIPDGMEMVRGGTDANGQQLYIGRGQYKDGMHPGTHWLGEDTLKITWGGDEFTVNNYELLYAHPASLQWVRMKGRFLMCRMDGFVPIVGGYESDRRPLYIIQGFYQDGVHCGKIREKSTGFLPYDGDEVTLSEYNVLVEYKSPQSVKKGRFKTMKEAGSWKTLQSQPGNKFSRMIPILTTSSSPSRIAFWLDEMDVRVNDNRWRVQSFVDSIALDGFYAHIKTWSPNVLFGAGFLSMQIESTDPEFRCGVVCHKAATIQRVSFDWRYERPPVVFIALCGFDIGRSPYISIKGDKVDCTGFDLEVEARNDTTTHKAWTTWIAFPENSKAIQYGSFSACDGQTIGSVTFSPAFDRPPTILTGFTKLDVSRLNIRLCIEAENVSHVGMDWRISTWSDSKINHVGANYIAFV